MNRTYWLKLGRVAFLVTMVALVLTSGFWLGGGGLPLLLVAMLLLIVPGQVQAHYYRDLYQARRASAAGRHEEAIRLTERFLQTLRERPGLRRMLWLTWSVYTTSVEAMALNNLGTAQLDLKRWDEAEASFRAALERDRRYPIPYVNLALAAQARGDHAAAEAFLKEAAERGFKARVSKRPALAGGRG